MTMKRIHTYALVALVSLIGVSCTGKFTEYNQAKYQPTQEELKRIPFGGYDLKNLMNWIIPNQENGFQMSFSLSAGPLAGYAGMPGHMDDFPKYKPKAGWLAYPFEDTFAQHLYNHYRPLKDEAKGNLSEPYYALGTILRVAIVHWVSDIYGPLPYSKVKGSQLQVEYDTQKELYTNMLADLKAATESLEKLPGDYRRYADFDHVYGGDMRAWTRYARSLALRMSIRISGADPEMAKQYAEWAVAGGVIESNEQNATVTTIDNPLYKMERDWTDSRAGADIVAYLSDYNDPRLSAMIRPGADGQYVGLRSPKEGIKGKKEIVNQYAMTNISSNSPIYLITASEVAFLKAEGTLLGWAMGGKTAQELYEEGVRLSFEQWGVSGADEYLRSTPERKGFDDPYIPSQSMPQFSSQVSVSWTSANGNPEAQKALIATQKWIALYPYNVIEAWSEWRRTGYPNLMPVVENASGATVADIHQVDGRDRGGIRRFSYPVKEYNSNKAGVQVGIDDLGGKDDLSTDLWWAK